MCYCLWLIRMLGFQQEIYKYYDMSKTFSNQLCNLKSSIFFNVRTRYIFLLILLLKQPSINYQIFYLKSNMLYQISFLSKTYFLKSLNLGRLILLRRTPFYVHCRKAFVQATHILSHNIFQSVESQLQLYAINRW